MSSAPSALAAPTSASASRKRDLAVRAWLYGLVALAVIGVAAIVGVGFMPHDETTPPPRVAPAPPAQVAAPAPTPGEIARPPTAAAPVDASTLTGDADARPVLAQGAPPPSPAPELPLRPTIVCRLLVDASGSVVKAEPYASRPGLEAFEEAALAAVKTWRFAPARKAGSPIAAWVNWPVTFQQPSHP